MCNIDLTLRPADTSPKGRGGVWFDEIVFILSTCFKGASEAEGVIYIQYEMENKEKDYQCCNRHELLDARRQLRKAGEPAEAVLWKCIKSRQILGFKFRRQFSVGPYILDFYCPEAKLGIELDGAGHCTIDGVKYDQQRSAYLFNERNIKLLRFENRDLYYNLEGVLNDITCYLRTMKHNV